MHILAHPGLACDALSNVRPAPVKAVLPIAVKEQAS
jgi:hypothetical protein